MIIKMTVGFQYYYGLDDGCSNPDEDSNYGAGGYNLMEVEYYTDLASFVSIL